ncbi:60S ribosomal protein L31 [Wickerhamomyces ciferrii]|uniref:60S ribosomal protein L31 n=1 Tax=Wickerhamomyces ciferrii (strain ATCC 14091 / BCRC 22168 / CBS 111 / JCM 3599 / NBRC 0793 / NRRL Y-1031 F-60-10) TaxID=1206466 RepID=K0KLI2_WICCF|nr:60S ribosomal protein L31 [Wickerhamomyces ciferrii]CCH46120.1 60S ribosomal protein L31 [Wickerhamomyces ciferrii]
MSSNRSALKDVVTREYTVNLHKRRAPTAVKEIKKFAQKQLGTKEVRLDPRLNQEIWKRGIKGVPFRLRVRISRKRNEEEDAEEKLFSYVEPVIVASAKGLQTVVVEEDEA